MPRNAAKKSNKNAKRLPVLIKLTNININNNKKKKVNSNENNNNNINKNRINSNNNNINNISIKDTATTTNTTKHKKKRKNTKIKLKAIVNATFTRSNQNSSNCDANITNLYSNLRVTTTTATTSTTDKSETTKNLIKLTLKSSQELTTQREEEENFNNFSKTSEHKEESEEETNICKTLTDAETETSNPTLTLLSETAICSLSPPSSSTATFPLTSPCNTSVSSLYPIVIETSEYSLKHHNDDKDNDKTTTEQKQQKQQQTEENNLNIKKKKIHSINNCCNCNNNNSNNNNNNISCTCCCHTAVDTLKQHNKSQSNPKNKNNNNNNNNHLTTSPTKRNFNNNNNNNNSNNNSCIKQQKQIAASVAASTSASLTSSSSSETTLSNQSQEVKARLATLRTRKKVLQLQEQQKQQQQQQQQLPSDKTTAAAQKEQKTISSSALESTTDRDCETKDVNRTLNGRQLIKKVSPVLDDATLNLIETLSEEVKKPNNKRKRSTSVALLSLATLYQPRPKRIAANPPSNSQAVSDKTFQALAGLTNSAIDNKNEQKQTAGNFLRPLPIEVSNTNTKKRARIMSLYERPFQTANDGRGSVVGNGYMTSSRSSNSSGGGAGGGAMVINDTSDTQEMANQYYLSGTSGSGIAGNSNPSLVGNGSAINHAPTMGTLCNIGNTCYLNSVVYTLRFAPQFLHNLHHLLADLNALQQNIARARAKSSSLGRGISAVHMENARSWSSKDLASMEQYGSGTVAVGPAASTQNSTALTQVTQKSSHQLLTEKLHELYQSLHRNEINESTEPHHADTLLHAIQDVSSIFEGNQQQDAHEFLMCLLNSIRETSQTLIKAIAECPDVILNGYISNPDEIERDLMKNHNSSGSSGIGGGIGGASNSNNSNSLASASSKTSSFFSRKSKRKDESKNSKNSRLQSPLKDAHGIAGNTQTTSTANSLFYLNTNDLNSSTSNTTPTSASNVVTGGNVAGVTSPSNSTSNAMTLVGAGDETDAPSAVALILKDKQRLEGKIRELGLDFFNEDFEGITVSTTKCLSCETITEQKETMIDIAVPVPQAGYESNEFMDRPSSFIQNSCITREYFRNENKYRCEQCCGYTEAIRSISYEVLPRLLIIQLSRFSGGMEKINSYIPTSFTLQCFCSKCCELSDANKLHIYKLYSVITHVGATMSVGHYIAYTCSLDWANEYINCPKEQRRRASQERNLGMTGNGTSSGSNTGAQSSGSSSGLGSSSTSFMKMKMKFGRSKASSSGDMSKNVKQLNGLNTSNNSKAITNGIGKLSMNNTAGGGGGSGGAGTPQCPITCQSINCCAMRLTAQQQLQYQSANNSTSDFSEESSQYSNGSGYNTPANYNNNIHHPYTNTSTSANTSGYGSTGRGSTKASYATTQNNCSEPIWYMCDDDKIKAMTQREFEELLSPARKITITPYLLFYARYNLQSTPPKSATASSSSPGPVTSSPQTSWSNESLQSSGHSAHSSGMRM